MPRIRYKVTLTEQERGMLEDLTTRGRHSSQSVLNALILLGCDEGPFQPRKTTGQQLADVLPVSLKKIDRVKRRFVEEGLEVALEKRKAERQYINLISLRHDACAGRSREGRRRLCRARRHPVPHHAS